MPFIWPWSVLLFVALCLLPCSSVWPGCPNRTFERREHGVDEVPYIVYLEMDLVNIPFKDPELQPYHGAGIIIDVNMVLTTAHNCALTKAKGMRVSPGQTYVNPKKLKIKVLETLMHPKHKGSTADGGSTASFDNKDLDYAFCLLRLEKSLVWGPSIQKAPLPFAHEVPDPTAMYMTSGWGPYKTPKFVQYICNNVYKNLTDEMASLFYSESKVASQEDCEASLKAAKKKWTKNIFCLGLKCPDHHTNLGDDGGPVVHVPSGKVVGVVANVRSLDNKKEFQPNSDLAYAVDWINDVRKAWVKKAPAVKYHEPEAYLGE